MTHILAISSLVTHDHVGLSTIAFALRRLNHEVYTLPTVLLSNHPGHQRVAGEPISPDLLTAMLEALKTNGWLGQIDAVLTGYLPTPAHVDFALHAIQTVEALNEKVFVMCDPILGDDPKGLYIDEDAALSIRQVLLPHADIATPNRFELAWLSGQEVTGTEEALQAAKSLLIPQLLATSIPLQESDKIANIYLRGEQVFSSSVKRLTNVPHGTGDFFSALFLSGLLRGHAPRKNLGFATAATQITIEKRGKSEPLALIKAQSDWIKAEPHTVTFT